MVDAVLDEGGKFVAEVLFPINHSGDQQGCTRHEDGSVTTPDGFKAAYAQFVESGWGTLSAPEAFGGQGMPHVVSTAFQEYMISANMAFAMYPGLSHGAIAALLAKGSPEQQVKYVPKMVSGEWGGTMNLTEPQCGTDLGLIRTRAEPQADGSYSITGTKIFISSGEHDLTENIIHLVLAKTPGAPDSSKGISLFVVPKVMVEDDGALGARNAVSCGSIEHKMGIHANSTCVMNYDGATGWLVGDEMKGLAAMFIMMNAARLGVGLQGLGVAETAYQNAVQYAHDRRQGRALTGPKPSQRKRPITLFVHPDVRRMLMEAKALTEGLRALCLWGALQVDLEETRRARPEEGRQMAADLIGLLTPVIKGVWHRLGLSRSRRKAQAGLWRPRLHRRMGHGAICSRCPHLDDLRGHQRRPGDGPRRPQAGAQGWPRGAGAVPRSSASEVARGEGRIAATADIADPARAARWASCRRRRCGS